MHHTKPPLSLKDRTDIIKKMLDYGSVEEEGVMVIDHDYDIYIGS